MSLFSESVISFLNLQISQKKYFKEQVKKNIVFQKMIWPFTVWINWQQKFCKFLAYSLEFQKFSSITRTIFSLNRLKTKKSQKVFSFLPKKMNQITFIISIFFQKMPNLPQKCMNPATLTRVSTTQATTCRHPSQLDNKINVVKLIQIIARIKFRYNSQDITWKKGKCDF